MSSAHANPIKAILLALGANFAIFVAKLAAAVITGSGAMMAEAVHSLADCGNQGLLLLGIRQARRAPSDEYPLGWGRALYFWSFLVAILLFSVGGMFSVYEGIHKLTHAEPLKWPWLAIGVLIFGEDLAALIGLCLATLAVGATMLTGNLLFDATGTIAIGVLLIVVAVLVAIEVKALLIGQGVEPRRRDELMGFLESRPEIAQVLNLITLQMGPDVMVAVKAQMHPVASDGALIDAINTVEAAMKAEFGDVRWSFFEPDNAD